MKSDKHIDNGYKDDDEFERYEDYIKGGIEYLSDAPDIMSRLYRHGMDKSTMSKNGWRRRAGYKTLQGISW